MMLGWIVALLAAAAVTPGQRLPLATPAPVFGAPAQTAMGYYLMLGTTIVSQPFNTASDCFKVLAKAKATMQPGTANLVCAHRRP
jgi:hypothetical protein